MTPRSQRRSPRRRQPWRSLPDTQRGIALLVAVLLVALGTILAAAVAYENAMAARRGTATYAFDEALMIAQGAEALAAYGLRQIQQNDTSHTTYIGQGWDKPLGPMEVVPGVMLEASLEDLQGRFNLNNLVNNDGTPDPVHVAAFTKLLEELGLETKWAGYVVDWIDADIVPQNPDGAEDSVYMGQTPPYRTANRYITSASELLALPEFGRDRYVKLAGYVVALPHGMKLNTCTAGGPVLDAFLPPGRSDYSDLEALSRNRAASAGCFPTNANYQTSFEQKPAPGSAGTGTGNTSKPFVQTSAFYRLKSFITIGGAEFNVYSLLYQDQPGGPVRPIQRSFTPD